MLNLISPTKAINKKQNLPICKEIAWNFDTDNPILEYGDYIYVYKDEAIKVWVYKALLTRRKEYNIYSWNYGSDIHVLRGKKAIGTLKVDVERYIIECLSSYNYILETKVDEIIVEGDQITAKVILTTVYSSEVVMKVNV